MLKRLLCSFVLLMNVVVLFAQQNAPQFWKDVAEQNITSFAGQYDRFIYPSAFRTVELDVQALRNFLRNNMTENQSVVIELPMPDGTTERFRIWEESVMHPDLQAKYPEIRCYTGQGVDDPLAIIKCDITPQGFHAMTLGAAKGQMFIDPFYHGFDGAGIVYFKKDYPRTAEDHFECHQTAEMAEPANATEFKPGSPKRYIPKADFAGDCQKRRYRLALACTGEYALFHGNTKPLVLAAMNTSMNRVNGVYEKDLAVTMQIIPNNDTLIFLNSASDPYTNNNGGTMLGQNQTTVTARIGAANYDIGHVFSTGGGGIAGLGVVCNNGSKARGVTGQGSPIGDPFDIDYVAHEMGHQFAGNHCFNNSCGGNINQSTAMEPGSGSTIMAYAGICSPNVQNNSDDYFHAINIQEIATYITTGTGNNCPVKTVTGNNAPVVNNVPNYIIPKSTPFALTAVATDADNDPLTYCWEQMDAQSATMPPVSTSTAGPLFRSFDPVASGTRTFPRLPDLVNNVNSTWEELPGVARSMSFRVVVRDNSSLGGCTDEDDVNITVNGNSGPFLVSAPNTNIIWQVGETQTVTWDVANTNAAPVNCANVKISLSTDGGFTYPVVLAENVPNNGSTSITVPNNISNTCRVKVEAVGNIFFDISNVNFRIQAPATPTFVLNSGSAAEAVCAGDSVTVALSTTSLAGFSQIIVMSVVGLPAGATAVFNPAVVTPGQPVTCTISGLTSAMAGNYSVVISGTSGTINRNVPLALTVLPGAPAVAPAPSFPADAASGVGAATVLTWGAVDFAQNYTVEISTNPGFNPAVTLTSDTIVTTASGLAASTPYYWRVKATNNCGESAFGEVFAFQTGVDNCSNVFTNNTPQTIDVGGIVEVNSTITINTELTVADVNVTFNIDHTWVGDLDAMLFSPANDSVLLFDRPGSPASADGCDGDDMVVTFDDEATQTAATLEDACDDAPAISGAYNALANLSKFDGTNAQGTWRLRVRDNYAEFDSGTLNSWTLSICTPVATNSLDGLLTNNPLTTVNAASKSITNAELTLAGATAAAQKRFTLLSLPANGTLTINGTAAVVGQHFTQADINANAVVYVHNGNTNVADQFIFDVLDQSTGGWLHSVTFLINIQQNTLSATAAVTQAVLCNNGTNGQITVTANGGTAPLQYSLNGGTAQSSNVFGGLAAGTYTVVVSDANGFTLSAGSATLTNPAAITASASVSFDDLTVSATGGTGTLEYSIDDISYNETGLFENLADGIYNYIVRDDNGCTITGEVAVSVSALLATVSQTAAILCYEAAQAAITVNVAGGFTPYEYSIGGNNYQSSNVFSGLVAGTYTVTVRDANGTTSSTSPITIGQPAVLLANATVVLNTVTLVATGGTAPYTYSVNGGAGQAGAVFTNLGDGVYIFTITDANGCATSTTIEVDIPALSLTSAAATGINPCSGAFDLEISATGGIPPLQYSITDGSNILTSPTPVFTGLQPGTYTVVVTDAALSTVSTSVTVAPLAALAATSGVAGNDVTVTATNGTAPYTFTLANGANNTTGYFENLPNASYVVTVTDANGCTATSSFTVNYSTIVVSFAITNVSCFGANDGSIIWNISGGLAPYSVVTPFPQMNLAPGTYTLTVTDAAGTVSTSSATVTGPAAPLALTATPNGNGTVTAAASGGTPPYLYSIDGGTNYQTGTLFTGVANGSYTLTVRDSRGCTTTSTEFMVSGIREVAATWGLAVTPNPSNGVFRLTLGNAPAGDLQWSVTDVLGRTIIAPTTQSANGVFQANIDLTPSPAGVYMLHLTNGVQHTTVLLEKM
jgi:subtilisin-like proprotein convertase family protein